MKAKTKQMILVGVAEPGKIYHVPLHAIYSEGKYLHFAIEVGAEGKIVICCRIIIIIIINRITIHQFRA